MNKQIAVIGLGFVGLTTALGLANKNLSVWGYDSDRKRCQDIKRGNIPFHEPGLPEAIKKVQGSSFFIAETIVEAVKQAQVIFLCVGTPCSDDGSADLSILLEAIRQIAESIDDKNYRLLVVKSTVPPGSTSGIIQKYVDEINRLKNCDLGVASNPEFLREGYAWNDFIQPDRIVLGVKDDSDWKILSAIYAGFSEPVCRVTRNEAEFIKYLSNSLLATLISFSNEMSMLAHNLEEINIRRTFNILHQDKRWAGSPASMANYVYPGCGFGGYCLPKDTQALAFLAHSRGLEPKLLDAVIETNHKIKQYAIERIANVASKQTTLGFLGLSFKPESDDVRDSPAATVIKGLLKQGYSKIIAHDPLANNNFAKAYGLPIKYFDSLDEITQKSDILIIATAWKEYAKIQNLVPDKKIIDLRYCLEGY